MAVLPRQTAEGAGYLGSTILGCPPTHLEMGSTTLSKHWPSICLCEMHWHSREHTDTSRIRKSTHGMQGICLARAAGSMSLGLGLAGRNAWTDHLWSEPSPSPPTGKGKESSRRPPRSFLQGKKLEMLAFCHPPEGKCLTFLGPQVTIYSKKAFSKITSD